MNGSSSQSVEATMSPNTVDSVDNKTIDTNGKQNGHHLNGEATMSGGGCPFFQQQKSLSAQQTRFTEWQTSASINIDPVTYSEYLQLDKVLNAQGPMSARYGNMVHDEHLFIITHQAYELWFKQIIFELDSIIRILSDPVVDDRCILLVVSRLQRINLIWKLLNEQIAILETMAPTDFLDFRGYLSTSSGFQSLQFRLFENKLGLPENIRVKFNQHKYDYIFTDDESKNAVKDSVEQPNLLKLIEAWLERTPGLVITQSDDENGGQIETNRFKEEYEKGVNAFLKASYLDPADNEIDEAERQNLLDEHKKTLDAFSTIFNADKHNKLMERGERKLSHRALWGALLIWLNRDEPRFHLPYQLLQLVTDLDAHLNKWRYNHALLVQRAVGNKAGTGGSSGYSYLRSTASDRYKVFYDIVNLSTWLIPREYVPKLSDDMKKHIANYK